MFSAEGRQFSTVGTTVECDLSLVQLTIFRGKQFNLFLVIKANTCYHLLSTSYVLSTMPGALFMLSQLILMITLYVINVGISLAYK